MIMIDLETLAVTEDAHILEIGWCEFTEKEISAQGCYLLCMPQGRHIDYETVKWHIKREYNFFQSNCLSLEVALQDLYLRIKRADYLWSKGHFDYPILAHALKQFHMPVPWEYWQVMDCRTLFNFHGVKIDVAHNAQCDAVAQAEGVIRCRTLCARSAVSTASSTVARAADTSSPETGKVPPSAEGTRAKLA